MKKIRKLFVALLTLSLLLSVAVTSAAAEGVTAVPSSANVTIGGRPVTFEAYTIGGNNYFKLRDLAMALMGTFKPFSIEWDGAANIVKLRSSERYIPVGGEMTASGNTAPVSAIPTTSTIYLDGNLVYAKAYLIGNSNYFKLRDIGAALNFSVIYDGPTETIKVDTSKAYYLFAIQEILPDSTYIYATNPTPPAAATPAMVISSGKDPCFISATEYSSTYYSIIADHITSDGDYAKLNSIFGLFVSVPDQVMSTLEVSKTNGTQRIKIENKTFSCSFAGQRATVTVDLKEWP